MAARYIMGANVLDLIFLKPVPPTPYPCPRDKGPPPTSNPYQPQTYLCAVRETNVLPSQELDNISPLPHG
jgi:hypothetical protein